MRLIGNLNNQAQAKLFSDFLVSENIDNQTEQNSAGNWEIWVFDEDRVETAGKLFLRFREDPDQQCFVQGAKAAAAIKREKQKKLSPDRNRIIDGRTVFYRVPVSAGIVTVSLIAASVAVALLTRLGKVDSLIQPFLITQFRIEGQNIIWYANLPEIFHGQVWRLFTPMFLHFGFLHILFNMLWLKDLGAMIETHKGSLKLLVLVLVIAALSNIGQYLVSGPDFGGMSGVVYGLLGYVWMQGKFNPASKLSLNQQTVTMMIIWFFICLSGMIGHIANTAHAVGAVTGIVWGYLSAVHRRA